MVESKLNLSPEVLLQIDQKEYLQNEISLRELKKIQTFCNTTIASGGGALIAGAIINPFLGLFGGLLSLTVIGLSRHVDRLVAVLEELLKIDGIIVTPRVKTEEGTIDLLVKMPDRRCFAFALRSKPNSRVTWREEKQSFYITTPRKSKTARVKEWAELMKSGQDLNRMTLSLKKHKSYLKIALKRLMGLLLLN